MSSSLSASRLSRRLIKLASLGLAGLIAGLLSGCTYPSDEAASIPAQTTYTWGSNAAEVDLPASLEARQAPSLHHATAHPGYSYGSAQPIVASLSRRP